MRSNNVCIVISSSNKDGGTILISTRTYNKRLFRHHHAWTTHVSKLSLSGRSSTKQLLETEPCTPHFLWHLMNFQVSSIRHGCWRDCIEHHVLKKTWKSTPMWVEAQAERGGPWQPYWTIESMELCLYNFIYAALYMEMTWTNLLSVFLCHSLPLNESVHRHYKVESPCWSLIKIVRWHGGMKKINPLKGTMKSIIPFSGFMCFHSSQ